MFLKQTDKILTGLFILIILLVSSQTSFASSSGQFNIEEADWDYEKSRLEIKGNGQNGNNVTVSNAATDVTIGSDSVDDDEWKVKEYDLTSVPCRIKATQSDGQIVEAYVKHAPSDCDNGNGGTPPGNNFTILAANDLGMHCADQDFRIFSILPPYNNINAQVLRKGKQPQMMSPADGISITYKAVDSNFFADLTDPNRSPDATDSFTSTGYNLPGIFKNNFWDTAPPSATGVDKIGFIAYEALYPPTILALFPSTPDLGLPAPDVEKLYLLGMGLHAEQSAMPGATNKPQPFNGYVENYPFFIDFPFGYTVNNFKRYTAEGVPISAIDDQGRSNPYPLMRIEARDASDTVVASIDAVVPVASEADCAICHASQNICDHDASNTLVCDNIANDNYLNDVKFIDDATTVIGTTLEQQVINSAKINIVRLHDFKYATSIAGTAADGTNGDGTSPNIVCANCHYSPALDLAHLGPTNENGKEQQDHISMSRAMHNVHGKLPQTDPASYGHLFPIMPPPGDARDPLVAEETLIETCYNCHPGKNAKCLRGAMGGSGTVCQDCHGQMTQVGDDFTENFPIAGFPAGADLTKRVSWASEPACDSCHVGDAMQVDQLKQSGALSDTVMNTTDSADNPDGLRLLLSYRLSDHKANGGPDNLTIFKFPDSRFATTEALYRLSGADNGTGKGHGGLSCEGCHGSTHAIWPNKNPFSNDNKAANDLQGHTGTIIECTTCHEGDLGITLEGPHGMHPVGDTRFSNGGHEDLAENNGDSCRACHGLNGEGSVLSRAATDRTLRNEDNIITLAKGEVVTCSLCHDNELASGKGSESDSDDDKPSAEEEHKQEVFIERFYENILGRNSDQGGMEHWKKTIQTDSSAKVAEGFFNSAEFHSVERDDSEFLNILYQTMFGRDPDEGGFNNWKKRLQDGGSRDEVVKDFTRSQEFENLSESFGVTKAPAATQPATPATGTQPSAQTSDFVTRFYTLVLNREPDQNGFDSWKSELESGNRAGGDIAEGFFMSEEFNNRDTDDLTFVDIAYRAFFGREADDDGKANWMKLLNDGGDRNEVLKGFIASQEFINLTNEYGIRAD